MNILSFIILKDVGSDEEGEEDDGNDNDARDDNEEEDEDVRIGSDDDSLSSHWESERQDEFLSIQSENVSKVTLSPCCIIHC